MGETSGATESFLPFESMFYLYLVCWLSEQQDVVKESTQQMEESYVVKLYFQLLILKNKNLI